MTMTNYDCTYRRNKITLPPGARMDSLFTPTAAQAYTLGTILELDDATGRFFRYCKNGGVALVTGFMNASEAVDAQQLQTVQTLYGVAAGKSKFNILMTTLHAIANSELKDGFLWVNATGTAEGDMYHIKDNKILTAGDDTVMVIEISDEGGLRNAIAATDDVSVVKNPYMDVVVNPASQAAMVVGVNITAVPINYYFWAQFRGICAISCDDSCVETGVIVTGEPVGKPETPGVAGACGKVEDSGVDAVWGTCIAFTAAEEAALINLMLP